MPKQNTLGSCHCGQVKFEAQIDFAKGTGRCNCKYCLKNRYWGVHIPPQDFRLIWGATLRSYSKSRREQPFDMGRKCAVYENDLAFCGVCGTHAFSTGNLPEIGGEYVSVSVACLDNVDFEAIMEQPINYMNGREDDWFSKPKYSAHL